MPIENSLTTPNHVLAEIAEKMKGNTLPEKVDNLTKALLDQPQLKAEVFHRFAPGIYIREATAPAGAIVVGHHHKQEHLNILMVGKVVLLNDDGNTVTLTAPSMFVCKPGRKVAYIEEDMVWQNVYSTDETDIEKLEEMFLDKQKSEMWIEHIDNYRQKLLPRQSDVADYNKFLEEFGLTEEQARAATERTDNVIPMSFGTYKFKVGQSNIEGKGIFATADFQPGEQIGVAREGKNRTALGRYTNHSAIPNAKPVLGADETIYLEAITKIDGCLGGHDGDEITIDYRESYKLAIQLEK
jgi:hypothetical protein